MVSYRPGMCCRRGETGSVSSSGPFFGPWDLLQERDLRSAVSGVSSNALHFGVREWQGGAAQKSIGVSWVNLVDATWKAVSSDAAFLFRLSECREPRIRRSLREPNPPHRPLRRSRTARPARPSGQLPAGSGNLLANGHRAQKTAGRYGSGSRLREQELARHS